MTRRTTRRQFFGGRSASTAPADGPALETPQAEAGPPTPEPAGESPLLHVSRPAMACQFEVFFNHGQYPGAAGAAVEALDLVEALEDQLSYFRPASQISRLNLVAADGPVAIEPRLFELLELTMDLHRQSDGAFDITSAPLGEVWGFARRQGALPAKADVAEALKSVGSRYVKLDAEKGTVQFTKEDVRLNLGSIGKGYALDRAAEVLAAWGIGDFLFHGGQSSVLARGHRAGASGEAAGGWTVGVCDPLHPERRLAEIKLRDRGLGTSGSMMQFFRHRGRRYAHILDPRTGQPAEGVLSVTVVAPTAALADGLSTAFFVMGPGATEEFCRDRPEIAALFVCPSAKSGRPEIHAMGFGGGELRILEEGLGIRD